MQTIQAIEPLFEEVTLTSLYVLKTDYSCFPPQQSNIPFELSMLDAKDDEEFGMILIDNDLGGAFILKLSERNENMLTFSVVTPGWEHRNYLVNLDKKPVSELSDLKRALFGSHDRVKVTQELYEYFMNVLPPINFGPDGFTTQEGDGDIMQFSNSLGRYFAILIGDVVVTEGWDCWFRVKRYRTNDNNFKVLEVWGHDGVYEAHQEKVEGKLFSSISCIETELGIKFRV